MSEHESVTLVLVEDDPGHARLIEKNLRRAHLTNDMIILRDGLEAVEYFFPAGEDVVERDTLPLLVLLDLHLPGLDGYQVLTRLKADARTRCIPVIILSTAEAPREIAHCYDLGCNIYLTKPVAYERFAEAICKLGLFLSVVTLPHGE